MPRRLIAGNWKMNGTSVSLAEVRSLIVDYLKGECEVLLCPPATLIARMVELAKSSDLMIGGQDCHMKEYGAHTGDISAEMLADAGASHVILGHSERRMDYGETDADVCAKAERARAAGLIALICIGETEADRDAGREIEVIGTQLANSVPKDSAEADTIIAYEPVWAIGSGRTPSGAQIAAVHRFIREQLFERFGTKNGTFRLLYGGSVKPANAGGIFAIPNVDGALVGGASLKAADLGAIVSALGG